MTYNDPYTIKTKPKQPTCAFGGTIIINFQRWLNKSGDDTTIFILRLIYQAENWNITTSSWEQHIYLPNPTSTCYDILLALCQTKLSLMNDSVWLSVNF